MNNIYMFARKDPDYDQTNNVIIVTSNEEDAINILNATHARYGYIRYDNFTVEKIGLSDKKAGTIILDDFNY